MRTKFTIAILAASVALLAGCTPAPAPAPSGSLSSSTPTPTTTASATPTATPVAAAPATCENLLDPTTLAAFVAAGYDVNPSADYAAKIRDDPEHYQSLKIFVDHAMCPVTTPSSFHVLEIYGYAPTTPAGEASAIAELVGEGWTETAADGGRLFLHPAGGEGDDIAFRYFFRNGFAWVAYDDTRLAEIIANSPAV